MFKKKIFYNVFICTMLSFNFCYAQSSIKGKIKSTNDEPIKGAQIKLLNFKEKEVLRNVVTDSFGNFFIQKLATGTYLLQIKCLGYSTINTEVFNLKNRNDTLDLKEIKMNLIHQSLEEVKIAIKTKKISQAEGKLTVNLLNNPASTGLSVLEEIEQLPGVMINRQNGLITLKGKEGAIIMINGKKKYMTNDAILQLLSSMSTSKIAKIELISNPSSAMDADGSAGIINLILKDNNQKELNGSLEIQAGIGKGNICNFNGDISIAKSKFSSYLSYSFNRVAQDQISFNSRENEYQNNFFSINTFSKRIPVQQNNNIKYGINYNLSDSLSVGSYISLYDNKWSMDATNNTSIKMSNSFYNNLTTGITEINRWKHFGINLNLKRKLKNNKRLDLDLDYLHYINNNPSTYTLLDNDKNPTLSPLSALAKHTPINILVPQINYIAYSSQNLELKTGVKISISDFNNNVNINYLNSLKTSIDSSPVIDSSSLKEDIFAGYGEGIYKLTENLSVNAGLRYEYTKFKLNSNVLFDIIDKSYGNFFPNLSFSYQLKNKNILYFFYNRRINRPTFNDIAPFVLYLDSYTIFTGNPSIQPSKTNNLGIDFTFKKNIFSIGYSLEKNALAKFQISVDPNTNIEFIKPQNLGNISTLNLNLIVPVKVLNSWDFQNSINVNYVNLDTGEFQNNRNLKQLAFQYNGSSTFKISPNLLMELSGFYNTTSLSGTSVIKSYGGLNFGVQNKFGKHSILRLNISDIFDSIKFTAKVNTFEYTVKNGYDFSQRTFKISFVYNWGETVKKITTANEEKKRVE